uniref:ABC transporter F family member 4-like n=1 Tax=Saccoglossus kowalevskii TaxID=10224 RepID=A0ABM0MUU2_SACKO|nr:PREDICTED: ABC transporter F family member 4-like [Saccoglossus kowalevskii]
MLLPVAAAILERPSTGRDLAKDAQDAAQLWAKMLSELFQPDATQPNRTKSAEEWRRRNSLDSLWSMESSLPEYEGPWPGKHRSMKPRIPRKITHKSNSAEAAVSLLRQSLRHADPRSLRAVDFTKASDILDADEIENVIKRVADENKKAKLESEPEPEQLETDQKSEASARSLNLEEAKADEIEPVTADVPVSDTQSVHSPTPSIKSARSTKSAKSIQEAFGGIKEGHIYHPASGGSGRGPQQSIPSERGSHDGTLDLDITHFRTDVPVARDEARKSARLMKGVPEDNKDQLKKSAEAAARVAAEEERRKAEEEEKRKQELASRKSSKSEKSKGSAGSKEATKKEFVVGRPKEKPQDEFLQPKPLSAKKTEKKEGVPKKEKPKKKSVSPKKETGKKKKGKKEKKDKGKDEEAPTPSEEVKDEEPEPVKEMTPVPVEEVPEPVIEKKVSPTPPPVPKEITPEPSPDGEGEEEEEEEDIDGSELSFLDEEDDDYDEDAGPGGPSRSQAKAAKRAAEAEKRRLAVERKLEEERRRLEEEERRKAEEEMMAKMAEEERAEYELRKKQEEEARKLKEMMERAQRELEAKLAQEEAQRLARELARKQKELEARLMFNRSLQSEAHGYDHTQDINRAFTWSYFELLQYLGIEIPEALKHKDF